MRHEWVTKAEDGWIDRTCSRCGRSEGVHPLPGVGGPLHVVYHIVGTKRRCPGEHGKDARRWV